MSGWDFTHVQDDVNPHILRILECIFPLDTAHMASQLRIIELYLLISSLKTSFYVKAQKCALQISIRKVKVNFNLRVDWKPGPSTRN